MSATSDSEPVSRRLADTLSATRFADLPDDVVAEARRAVLDWLGSALAGALERPACMARDVVAGLGASEEATVFGGGRASAAGAALANGVASHVLELDDVHKGSTLHPAAPVIPAALAMAEREHASGEGFLLAVVVGYEAALRVGEAVNPSHYAFWHPTGTAATFGAAVAAASILGLDATHTLHALGSAGTQAAGLWEFNADGAMSKPLHAGKAAFNGVLSAELALVGFTGASRILEGKRGFFRATSTGHDGTRITDGLGTHWKILENCYKLHSCCGHTHSAIDVALDLRKALNIAAERDTSRIASIRIGCYGPGYEIVKEPNPRTTAQAQFSIAYCVAAALAHGRVGLEQFAPELFDAGGPRAASVRALLSRTTVVVEDDLTNMYPAAWPARVTVTLDDAIPHRGEAKFPRGNPENPVSTRALEEKFRSLVEPRYGSELAEQALAAVRGLRSCDDMAVAFADLARASASA